MLEPIHKLAAQVGGQEDNRVFEIDRPAFGVGQAAVVQNLEQNIKDLRMGLLNLVKKQDGVRPMPHRFGQSPALVITDIAGRRANHFGNGILLHILAHINPNQGLLVVKHKSRQGFGQLGFADAGRSEEHKGTNRPVGIGDAGSRALDRFADFLNRLGLTAHPPGQLRFHPRQFAGLAFEHPRHRHVSPTGHYPGDIFLVNFFFEQSLAAGRLLQFLLAQF